MNNYEFFEILQKTQSYISQNYSTTLTKQDLDKKNQLKSYIKKYIEDTNTEIKGVSEDELVNKLYSEMSEFGLITDYLDRNDVEEININAYDDIKVTYSNGEILSTKEIFNSPDHALDVVKRLLRKSNITMDNSSPIAVGHLDNKIRITAINKGVVDDNVGVVSSIRIVNPKKLTKEDFINYGTGTEEMLDFIALTHKYGASTCFTGETSSGKTTLLSYVLSQISNNKRLFSIESNTREMDLREKVMQDGQMVTVNNIVHTKTKIFEDEKKSIDMSKLLETSLTFNPDYICVAEMKSKEAFFSQEASKSGHIVSTTTHASSCRATYERMLTLCKLLINMDDKTLYKMLYEAFPIVVFCKKLADNTRRILEITECVLESNGADYKVNINTLYKFDIEKNIKDENGKIKVIGEFKKVNNISKGLQEKLKMNGILEEDLEKLLK